MARLRRCMMLLTALVLASGEAGATVSTLFVRTWSEGPGDFWPQKAVELSDGGFVVVGSKSDGGQGQTALVIRTDAEGVELWRRSLGSGLSMTKAFGATPDASGGFTVLSYTRVDDGTGDGVGDVSLTQFDAAGESAWAAAIESGVKAFGGAVATRDDGLLIAAFGFVKGEDDPKIAVRTYDATGGLVAESFSSSHGVTLPAHYVTLTKHETNTFFLSYASLSFIAYPPLNVNRLAHVGEDLRTDWVQPLFGPYTPPAGSINFASIYQVDAAYDERHGLRMVSTYPTRPRRPWVTGFDGDGRTQWDMRLNEGTGAEGGARGVAFFGDDGAILTRTVDTKGSPSLAIIDAAGTVLQYDALPAPLDGLINALIPTRDGNFLLLGEGGTDMWLAKLKVSLGD